jgi:hypothetical protein
MEQTGDEIQLLHLQDKYIQALTRDKGVDAPESIALLHRAHNIFLYA